MTENCKKRAIWALVPVKSLDRAKQRLEPCLGDQRAQFTVAMLKDVLSALIDSRAIDNIAVITADPLVKTLVEAQNLVVITESKPRGLNTAIRQGVDGIRDIGGAQIAIMPADIPLATGAEIDRILGSIPMRRKQTGANWLAISPSADRRGTNFLCFDAKLSIPFRYGEDSYQQHLDAAKAIEAEAISIDSETLSIDIDEPGDLDRLVAYCQSKPEFQTTETWKYLQQNDFTTMIAQENRMQQ